MCRWGFSEELAAAMASSLRACQGKQGATPNAKRVCRRSDGDDPSLEIGVVVSYLGCILHDEEARTIFARDGRCEELLGLLRAFVSDRPAGEVTKEVVVVLCRLALHYANETGDKAAASLAFKEASLAVLPRIDDVDDQGSEEETSAFLGLCEALASLCCDALAIDIFAKGLEETKEVVSFARKGNALAMKIRDEGASDAAGSAAEAVERQMKRLVPLLVAKSLASGAASERETNGGPGEENFDKAFQDLEALVA